MDALFSVQVRHSSDHDLDGLWHEIEDTSDLRYAVERGAVFMREYRPRPVRIFDRMAGIGLTVQQAFEQLRRAA